jgi:hypothetical protein
MDAILAKPKKVYPSSFKKYAKKDHAVVDTVITCKGCKVEKRTSEFKRSRTARLGVSGKCRACLNVIRKARRLAPENRERILAAEREKRLDPVEMEKRRIRSRNRYARNLEFLRGKHREYSRRKTYEMKKKYAVKADPLKRRARKLLGNAVANGSIAKPSKCEDCHNDCERHRLHGHHEDYNKPLDVVWLCHRCHFKRHGRFITQDEVERYAGV